MAYLDQLFHPALNSDPKTTPFRKFDAQKDKSRAKGLIAIKMNSETWINSDELRHNGDLEVFDSNNGFQRLGGIRYAHPPDGRLLCESRLTPLCAIVFIGVCDFFVFAITHNGLPYIESGMSILV